MKTLLRLIACASIIVLVPMNKRAGADEKLIQMNKIRESFAALQPFLADEKAFESSKNREEVLQLLTDLKENFHSVSEAKTDVERAPGFAINISIVSNLLADVASRYEQGKTSYAFWRVRKLSANCVSCHAQYNISAVYSGDENLSTLTHYEKGEYFLATRQLHKALAEFKAVVNDPENVIQQMQSLRRLLIIFIRLFPTPEEALTYFQNISPKQQLSRSDQAELDQWIVSLKKWSKEKVKNSSLVSRANDLVAAAITKNEGFFVDRDEVSLLRAVSLGHQALAQGLSGEERSRALLIIGYSYSLLPSFFINELPEIYLEQCILEFPASANAKKAYQAYNDKIILEYSGISGSDIPADISARLKELHDKAYGVPQPPDKI